MQAPIVRDGLWRCLCPSYRPNLIFKATRSSRPQALRTHHRLSRPATCNASGLVASRHSTISTSQYRKQHISPTISTSSRGFQSLARLVKGRLEELDTTAIYDNLRVWAATGNQAKVTEAVRYLIYERQERPNVRLYSALILVNVSPLYGTAGKVAALLQDMRHDGIELDAGTCHDVLEALAVHPDYLLRNEIIEYMEERWLTLNNQGHNFVVAGMLRDRMFESALEKIESMARQGMHIQPWLYDKAVYMLCDIGEIDEAYKIMRNRRDSEVRAISPVLWSYFLDTASKYCHHEATKFVWESRVKPSYLQPSSGLCLNVLNTAARHGDAHLATDVFRVLTNRNTIFDHQHYEMLLEAYINAGDIKTALSVLIIMQDAGVKPDDGTTSPILRHLQQDPERPMEAFTILQAFEQAGMKIPIAAVNCTIQAAVAVQDLEQAIEFYKALHVVSPAGPNTATFNILFRGCSKMGRKELAMFLAAEMIQLKVPPDSITYDRLILVCVGGHDIDDAFQYYEEMRDQGFIPRGGTFTSLVKACVQAGDSRAEEVIEDMRHLGINMAKLELWINAQKRKPNLDAKENQERNRTPDAFDFAGVVS
ncbi:hypothetical protein AOQ84DRAFT_348060 [Glonium stellatum]|uniref:Pentatricopeptide repeat-containing protein-mitochondrial domain-containing protein n=1 Tax=Glonium stellatum TaxID=574774 RepID=A0A8E2ERE2_9PEZI|nr:hypothetical protein AOQ84DRAFT_348060 [Glonium stellatum]